jgi:hypothetical protein
MVRFSTILLLIVMIGFITVAPVKSQPQQSLTFDLTASTLCACSTPIYKFHLENPTDIEYAALWVTIPAGYTIDPAYMTTTPGIVVATGIGGDVNPPTTDHTLVFKTSGTSGIFELFEEDVLFSTTGVLTPPTPTSPGSFNLLSEGVDNNFWAEVSFVAGFFVNPCTPGTYSWSPNTATPVSGAVLANGAVTMDPRPGYSNTVTIVNCAIGGVVTPVNKLEILTPYLALAGLVAVSAVVLVKRRRA